MEMVENLGLPNLGPPHIDHVKGKIWELRAKSAEGIARALYFTHTGRLVVIAHVFVKKTQKTPARRDRAGGAPDEGVDR